MRQLLGGALLFRPVVDDADVVLSNFLFLPARSTDA
jgi:hypothetical protein